MSRLYIFPDFAITRSGCVNRILIAEDEPRIVVFLEEGLRTHGFTLWMCMSAI